MMMNKYDDTVMDEYWKIYAKPVQSDFELAMKVEINAWIKKQPPHKSWATPAKAAQEFWNERLN
jgi:hypothetical protein